jgi:hypothetical protein
MGKNHEANISRAHSASRQQKHNPKCPLSNLGSSGGWKASTPAFAGVLLNRHIAEAASQANKRLTCGPWSGLSITASWSVLTGSFADNGSDPAATEFVGAYGHGACSTVSEDTSNKRPSQSTCPLHAVQCCQETRDN